MPKKGKWEDWEVDYLYKHYEHKTDVEMATDLGRTKNSVVEMRRKQGIKKNKKSIKPEDIQHVMAEHTKLRESTNIADLDDAQQRRFWINSLKDSPIWSECLVMFEEDELELYKMKWVDFMMTFDTINEIEKGSVHIMISCLIRINRYQKLEKEYRDISKGNEDSELAAKSISLHREMKDMAEMYLKSQQDLDASRSQRIKKEGEQKINLLELLKELEKKEAREKFGREADAFAQIKQLETQRLRDGNYIRGSE